MSDTKAYCEEHDVPLEIHSIRVMESQPAGRYGLTDEQCEALTIACERGYFGVPSDASLEDLASELDIPRQAFGERLRRAIDGLVGDALLVDEAAPRPTGRAEGADPDPHSTVEESYG